MLSVVGDDIWGQALKQVIKDLVLDIDKDAAAGYVNLRLYTNCQWSNFCMWRTNKLYCRWAGISRY